MKLPSIVSIFLPLLFLCKHISTVERVNKFNNSHPTLESMVGSHQLPPISTQPYLPYEHPSPKREVLTPQGRTSDKTVFSKQISDASVNKTYLSVNKYNKDKIDNAATEVNHLNYFNISRLVSNGSESLSDIELELLEFIQFFDNFNDSRPDLKSLDSSSSTQIDRENFPREYSQSDPYSSCKFSNLEEILEDLNKTSFCLVESKEECITNWEGRLMPKIIIFCDESTQIEKIEEISLSPYRNLITELRISDQRNMKAIRKGEFIPYPNLTVLSVTNTTLETVDENAFEEQKSLQMTDLRFNQLRNLTWRIFFPEIINGDSDQELLSISSFNPSFLMRNSEDLPILVAGNPLESTYCSNEWVTGRNRVVLEEPWSSSNESFGSDELEDYWSAVEPKKVPDWSLKDQCSSSRKAELGCYLCPLQILAKRRKNRLSIECRVEGDPQPRIGWIAPLSLGQEALNSTSAGAEVSQTILLNVPIRVRKEVWPSQPLNSVEPFAGCGAFSERGFHFASVCELEVLTLHKLSFVSVTSLVNMEVKISSVLFDLDPSHWKWTFSPCVHKVSLKSNLTFTFTSVAESMRTIVVGMLHYTRTDLKGFLPGWYKLEVKTLCGRVENTALYYEGLPHQNSFQECPMVRPHQRLNVGVTFVPRDEIASGIYPTLDPDDSIMTNLTSSFSQDAKPGYFSLLSAILIGLFSVVVAVSWVVGLLFMRRFRMLHSHERSSHESPFKIVFLDRNQRCKKGTRIDLPYNDTHFLNRDRLVENPEYVSGSDSEEQETHYQIPTIKKEHLKLVSKLGEGAFGRVYLGLMENSEGGNPLKVALKTSKTLSPEAEREIKMEVEMLTKLQHEKIITFYGVCYDSDAILMAFEYMDHGDLNHYLKLNNEDCYHSETDHLRSEPLTIMDCLQIALQIASGIRYLASQHYVHRDLATRNCLVAANLVVKIGDFGMSRDVYTSDYYQIGGSALLPIRWMPPESILYRRFTIQSDTWSFGVVLWEIFTGGKQPWYGYTNQEVITQITAGKFLSCPDKCPQDMYSLMVGCWAKNPHERISIDDLYLQIKRLTTIQPNFVD